MRVARHRIRVAVLVTLVGLVLAPASAFVLFAYGPRWESRFEGKSKQIQSGMTLEEVNATIGFEGQVREHCPGLWSSTGIPTPFVHGDTIRLWELGGEEIWVGFENGRVVSKYFHDTNYL